MTFKVSHNEDSLDVSFSATLRNIDRAAEETKKFLSSADIDGQSFNVILVMREALNNAVVHGCCNNYQKIVTYNLRIEDDRLIMEVADGGHGFDWRACLEEEPSSTRTSGRGLSIMKKYFTKIGYNEKGNRLILRMKI